MSVEPREGRPDAHAAPGEAVQPTLYRPVEDRTERRAVRWIALCFGLAAAAGVGLLVLYALGGQAQLEGVLLFLLLGGIGFGLILWGKYLFPTEIVTDEREPHESEEAEFEAAAAVLVQGEQQVARRSFLVRMLLGALGALGLAAIFPVRSLGPSPGRSLFVTSWTPGALLVDETGQPVKATDLEVGGVVTVFPEGHISAADSQAILVRVQPDQLRLPAARAAGAPDGLVCYSKLCTHAGCPVGLYLKRFHELQCPCHFSAFNVLDGAEPVFGPAARPLPQLLIEIDPDGFLRAKGDFTAPVGPGFWNRGSGP